MALLELEHTFIIVVWIRVLGVWKQPTLSRRITVNHKLKGSVPILTY